MKVSRVDVWRSDSGREFQLESRVNEKVRWPAVDSLVCGCLYVTVGVSAEERRVLEGV